MLESERIKINANMDGLNKLLRTLKSDYVVRVGILGSQAKAEHKTKGKESGLTNAELGTIHEQPNNDGTKIPKRSFLEMPLKLKLALNDNDTKDVKKAAWKKIFIENKPKEFFTELGTKALDIVIGAFETNGYGEWVPWSKAYERRRVNKIKGKKKRQEFWLNHNILTDTGQLRRSISFKVIKNK